MSFSVPVELTSASLERLQESLAAFFEGREDHAAFVAVSAVAHRSGRRSKGIDLIGLDAHAYERCYLGWIADAEGPAIIEALFAQVRAWRAAHTPDEQAAAAVAGGAR